MITWWRCSPRRPKFDWYFSGDVEVSTASTRSGITFHVSAPSADHLERLGG